MEFILASTSPYRRELLQRIGLTFEVISPSYDEGTLQEDYRKRQQAGEEVDPVKLATQLAVGKAKSVWSGLNRRDGIVVIGADQLVSSNNYILGKPGSDQKAREQLMALQGNWHELITVVALCKEKQHSASASTSATAAATATETETVTVLVDRTRIKMRNLSAAEVSAYVALDQPLDCAGAYKFEKHGILLVENLECKDPSAIQGLPLIQLMTQLRKWGLQMGSLRGGSP